jgi:hypothetical protein
MLGKYSVSDFRWNAIPRANDGASGIPERLSQMRPSFAKIIDHLLPFLWRHLVDGFGLAHHVPPFLR